MRLKTLRKRLLKKDKFPYLISSLTNIHYLTGFEGSYGNLLIDEKRNFFITDSRYTEYAKSIFPESTEIILQKSDISQSLKEIFKLTKIKQLFIEQSIALSSYLNLKEKLTKIKIIPEESEADSLRIIKDKSEIEILRKAVAITDNCFNHLLRIIKPGIIEWDIAVEIEYYYRKNGCKSTSFDSIVASGKGSSMPHYITSMTKKIEYNDILLIDMGCLFNGYNSDLTRTVFIGSISQEFRKIYNIVKNAQEEAINKVKSGITAAQVDKAARDYIKTNGYGFAFGHSLGHGVGLEIHESPRINPANPFRLKNNIPFTIEPGIYIPEKGGIRIEDVVVVNNNGCENLTKSSKEIIIL